MRKSVKQYQGAVAARGGKQGSWGGGGGRPLAAALLVQAPVGKHNCVCAGTILERFNEHARAREILVHPSP